MLRWHASAVNQRAYGVEEFDVTHMTGDHAKIAERLGAEGIIVTEPRPDRAGAGAEAERRGTSVLIDVHPNMGRSRFDQGGGGQASPWTPPRTTLAIAASVLLYADSTFNASGVNTAPSCLTWSWRPRPLCA